jgi:hypothetical protein
MKHYWKDILSRISFKRLILVVACIGVVATYHTERSIYFYQYLAGGVILYHIASIADTSFDIALYNENVRSDLQFQNRVTQQTRPKLLIAQYAGALLSHQSDLVVTNDNNVQNYYNMN